LTSSKLTLSGLPQRVSILGRPTLASLAAVSLAKSAETAESHVPIPVHLANVGQDLCPLGGDEMITTIRVLPVQRRFIWRLID